MTRTPAIEVLEARTHNLKGISCRIPHGRVTVVTGLSGAGKSSLAFDTVYAEAQRRFVESMSTYARQFMDQMERPPITAMNGILPAVALVARNAIKNARSTVGTITEIHDVLRLLYTHLGEVRCPNGHGAVDAAEPDQVVERLIDEVRGADDEVSRDRARVLVIADLPRPKKQANDKLRELVRQGFFRRLDGETIERMTPSSRWLVRLDPLALVLGRFKVPGPDGVGRTRLVEAIEQAYALASGRARVVITGEDEPGRYVGRVATCAVCGAQPPRPQPALFSFNSPLGACPTCQGFGRVVGIDPERVVPDPEKSLDARPIAPWNSPAYEDLYEPLFVACRARGVALDVPWSQLPKADRDWIWQGKKGFTSIDRFFARLERRSYRMHVRVLLARYRAYEPCSDCDGRRLRPEALAVRMAGATVSELSAFSIEQLRGWLVEQQWTAAQMARAGHLLEQLRTRLDTLHHVGLDYLSLDRQARTLSGGEAQRIQLASALGSGLTSTLYVLDEPTIGLHPRDTEQLLALLRRLSAAGNTVLVVEHDRALIGGADHVIDLGPRAGEHGGEVVAEGTPDEVFASETSLTAAYMRPRDATPAQEHVARFRREKQRLPGGRRLAKGPRVTIEGASGNNLRGIDVEWPLGALVAVTGVSGSGKSTLVGNVLYGTYQRSRGKVDVDPGPCTALRGLDRLGDVVLVDQRPLGRSSRSNPVTYIKAYDEIRKLFASTEDARRGKITPGHFSFNLDRGRCPECKGTGALEVDMHFMASVTVPCDVCQGRRFRPEILAVTLRGRNIHETLELTVDAALEIFDDQPRLCRRLQALADVGLGYLRLGQSTATLSGGEAQRLKLASFLDGPRKGEPRLFLFDEPTTGLHLADIDLLYMTFRRLIRRGHGVVVVEHSLDLIARADWIVDLGPGGGVHGGQLLYSGPLESFLDRTDSPTADALRDHLGWRRRLGAVVQPAD